jgi:outer membrane protein OmpA-like peptidoglycan-associated protein
MVVAIAAVSAGTALAQSNVTSFHGRTPSADELVDALTPKAPASLRPTRGIRVVPNEPTAKPIAQQAAADLTVNFEFGSAELTNQAKQVLDNLGRALQSDQLRGYRFEVEGHTDSVGSRPYNQSLSERRAEAVKRYLQTNFGISASRLDAVGFGEDKLLENLDPTSAENRRVRVVNLGH